MNDPSLQTTVQIDDFQIERRLGVGGMGIVYQARQLSLNRVVALKVLGSALTQSSDIVRFRRAAQAAARLRHPNIATIYFVGQGEDICYMAMELVEGCSLQQWISWLAAAAEAETACDPVSVAAPRSISIRFDDPNATNDETPNPGVPQLSAAAGQRRSSAAHHRHCCEIVRSAARALDYAHSQGVLHRDIKPGNVMLDRAGQVYIIDFGLARYFEDATVTQTGQLIGTPMYMSPEQVVGRLELDERTDIYSLGLVLYEMLTLQPCLTAPSREELLRRIITKPLPPIRKVNSSVPAALESIVHFATAKDIDERYSTARDFADDLERFLEGTPVKAPRYRYRLDERELLAARPEFLIGVAFFHYLEALLFIFIGLTQGVLGMVGTDTRIDTRIMCCPIALAGMGIYRVGRGILLGRNWAWWAGLVIQVPIAFLVCAFFALLVWQEWPSQAGLWLALAGVLLTGFPLVASFKLLSKPSREWFRFAAQLRAESRIRTGR